MNSPSSSLTLSPGEVFQNYWYLSRKMTKVKISADQWPQLITDIIMRWRCSKNKRAHIKTGPTCRHLVEEFSINKYTILSSPFWAEFTISWIFHPRGRLVRYLGLYTHSCIENVKMATKRISTSYSAKVHLTLHQLRGALAVWFAIELCCLEKTIDSRSASFHSGV